MWLLDIEDLDNIWLRGPFLEANAPVYAILSHTWGSTEEELTFQDMQNASHYVHKKGWAKIKAFCTQAHTDGYRYAWVDTVCIDKKSSAELSEAINSMYKWYSKAGVCYAFLEDWQTTQSRDLKYCRWFTRGWTLQELIAPRDVRFYNTNWQFGGSLKSLQSWITRITGIDESTLGGSSIRRLSVARRMSWASKRMTTREEDEAYCLLGIFGVNMPLLYGEGKRAFIRLQEEVLRKTEDHTIFAWDQQPGDRMYHWSLLAPSPRHFKDAAEYIPIRGANMIDVSVSSNGVLLNAPLTEGWSKQHMTVQCRPSGSEHFCTIPLIRMRSNPDEYARLMSWTGISSSSHTNLERLRSKKRRVLVRSDIYEDGFEHEHALSYIRFTVLPVSQLAYSLKHAHPAKWYDPASRILSSPPFPFSKCGAIFRFEHNTEDNRAFMIVFLSDSEPSSDDCTAQDNVAVFNAGFEDTLYSAFDDWNCENVGGVASMLKLLPGSATKEPPTSTKIQSWRLEDKSIVEVHIDRDSSVRIESLAAVSIVVWPPPKTRPLAELDLNELVL